MLTVHGAKGLEAPIVFVVDVDLRARVQGLPAVARARGPAALADGQQGARAASRQAAYERARARQLEEQRRLLYVGLTRAREHLIVAGCERKSGKETDLARAGRERARARRARSASR